MISEEEAVYLQLGDMEKANKQQPQTLLSFPIKKNFHLTFSAL
jgi:hypothetical protein